MKIHMISLGCDKNRVDSEKMLSNLLEKYPGSELTDDPAEADITVINTCAFIGDAKEESINTIIENGEYKETGRLKKLIVAGCLAERYREEIRKELPEVDEVIGVKEYVERLDVQMKRVENAENYTAYLKIAEGCDKCCTYCIIPKLRGKLRSRPIEELVKEAEQLIEELKRVTMESVAACEAQHISDFTTIKSKVKSNISGYLYKTTRRSPMILPVITEI